MKKILFILLLLFSVKVYSQTPAKPSPYWVGKTFQQITTTYPNYYANPLWYGVISYWNGVIPGEIDFYFSNNVCYAMQAYYSNTDSVATWNAFNSYISYVRDSLHANASGGWDGTSPYDHYWWGNMYNGDSTGGGAIMFDASNIRYNQKWRDGKLYYMTWISFFRGVDNTNTLPTPKNVAKAKL